MSKERCQAPFHVEGCDKIGNTKDHITPQCIGHVLGWTDEQIEAPENIQWLSSVCHAAKDESTEERRDLLLLQMKGEREITLKDVRRWAKKSPLNEVNINGRNKAVYRRGKSILISGGKVPPKWPYKYVPMVFNQTTGELEKSSLLLGY